MAAATDQPAGIPTQHTITENLEVLRNFLRAGERPPSDPGIMSTIRTCVFVGSPVLILGFLSYILCKAAGSSSEPYCVCPDGGVRSNVSRRRMAA